MLVERARRLLERGGVVYETLPHREAYTAQGVASAVHVSGWMLAKVLVVRAAGEGPVMVVLPASCRMDPAALGRAMGKANVALVPEDELPALFPDCEPGAMPPLGPLYGQAVFADVALAAEPAVIFNAGTHEDAIAMRWADFARAIRPIVGRFAEQRRDRVPEYRLSYRE